MNRLFAILLGIAMGVVSAGAQSPEEQYVRIYNLIQQADALQTAGQSGEALPKYLEANTALQRIKRIHPEWQPKIVSYRLNYLAEKIAAIPGAKPAVTETTAESGRPPTPVVAPGAVVTPAPSELQQQLAGLQESVRRLNSEKTILESKLREALATQPAAIDPRELTKAQEKVQSLLKENELLKAGLAQEQARPTSLNARELEEAKRALADANSKLAEQVVTAGKLAAEKGALQEQVGNLTASAAAAEVLRTENTLLKTQLAQVRSEVAQPGAGPTTSEVAGLTQKLAEAEASVAAMRSDTEVLRLEKIALESRLKKVLATPAAKSATVSREADLERIRDLEQQRDDYLKKLDAANRELQSGKNQEYALKVEQLTREVAKLKSRVEVFEARAIPYSAEELALFQHEPPKLAPLGATNKVPGRRSITDLPASTVALAAQAKKHFAAKDYAKAEESYLEILRQDETNADTHANLGAIQLELDRLDEAEKHIQQALAAAPDDVYAVSLWGYLKYRQEKFDEAIVALNRAAKLNPQDADIQNYLGATLIQKGLRGPAEQVFRKAVVLSPGHAGAHYNLAVFYAAENPPNVPLARFHYRKALAAGHPPNPDVEKLFEKKEAGTP